jgi:lambda family phage tail tape measure protein
VADIATLGIKVTTDGVAQAASDLDKLNKSGGNAAKAAQQVAPAMDRAALSAKQLQAATRQLPMQFTDIFTGLASGQKPLQVLLQQGGQLKDVFGGIGPALRASAGYITSLINPLTLAAGAVAALGTAYFKGAQESVEFNKALILTGNYADTTADALADMATQMDAISGVTTRSAAAALAEVASTGRFTADQITLVATAAENMRAGTGKAVQETVKEFLKLREDPVRAILQLNDTYHFLTRSTYDQIKALQEQGREADAATVAIEAYAGAINSRIPQVTENLGFLERAWKGIKSAASEAWDEMLGIGRKTTPTDLRSDIEMWQNDIRLNPRMSGVEREMRERQIRDAQAEIQRLSRPKVQVIEAGSSITPPTRTVDSAQIRAEDEFQKVTLRYLTDRERLEKEIVEIRAAGLKAGKSEAEIQQQITRARAQAAGRGGSGGRGGASGGRSATDFGAPILQQLRQQIALNQEQLGTEQNLTTSQRLRVRVMEQMESLGTKLTAAQRAEIQASLEQLKVTDDQVSAMTQEARLKEDLIRLNAQLEASEANRARANEIDLMGIGRGADQVDRQRRALDIAREYEDGLRALRDRGVAEDSESWRQQEAALRASRDRMLQMEGDYYAERDRMQADWKNGAVRAFEDYMAAADDVAGRTADAINGILGSMQGMFEEFFKTGKLDWKGFLDDINAELARFFSQQLVKQIIGAFGGGQTTGTQGGGSAADSVDWASIIGSFFGGGRAAGGPVKAGRFYEVGERGPELLRTNGRNFLIPGRDGVVQPNMGGGQRAGVTMQVTNTFSERVDRRSRSAIESSMYRATTRAQGRR